MASVIHHRRRSERESARERAGGTCGRYKYGFPVGMPLHLEILDGPLPPPSRPLDLSSSLPLYRTRTSMLDRRAINKKTDHHPRNSLRTCNARARQPPREAGRRGGKGIREAYSPHAKDEGKLRNNYAGLTTRRNSPAIRPSIFCKYSAIINSRCFYKRGSTEDRDESDVPDSIL